MVNICSLYGVYCGVYKERKNDWTYSCLSSQIGIYIQIAHYNECLYVVNSILYTI